ncbi:MAG: response regulator [Chitinivibrionales bacterium]|nr:response regulator [Chitinivibrionales bacterium]
MVNKRNKNDMGEPKKRILVVDDEEIVLDLLTEFLTNKGFEVIPAINARQAAGRMKDIDLIILDLMLSAGSDVGGNALMGHLRQNKNGPIPIIIYSGHILSDNGNEELMEIERMLGMKKIIYACVPKSSGIKKLLSTVNDCFAGVRRP